MLHVYCKFVHVCDPPTGKPVSRWGCFVFVARPLGTNPACLLFSPSSPPSPTLSHLSHPISHPVSLAHVEMLCVVKDEEGGKENPHLHPYMCHGYQIMRGWKKLMHLFLLFFLPSFVLLRRFRKADTAFFPSKGRFGKEKRNTSILWNMAYALSNSISKPLKHLECCWDDSKLAPEEQVEEFSLH